MKAQHNIPASVLRKLNAITDNNKAIAANVTKVPNKGLLYTILWVAGLIVILTVLGVNGLIPTY